MDVFMSMFCVPATGLRMDAVSQRVNLAYPILDMA